MASKKSFTTIITILYASIYGFIFFITSIAAAVEVRKIRKIINQPSKDTTQIQSADITQSKKENEEAKYDQSESIELETKSNGMFLYNNQKPN